MEYSQDPRDVQVSVKLVLLYSSSVKSPGSTFDYDNKIERGWTTSDSLTSVTKASIDTSIEGVIEAFTPKVSASVSSEVTTAATVSNQASQSVDIKVHLDLSNPVYLYQAQISANAPGYGSITGFGGYFQTGEPLPPISGALSADIAAANPQEQRQYRICNTRSAPSTLHYRAITYDGFWGKGSYQYDVTLKQNDCSYPQNINEDYLKIWWEAYGSDIFCGN